MLLSFDMIALRQRNAPSRSMIDRIHRRTLSTTRALQSPDRGDGSAQAPCLPRATQVERRCAILCTSGAGSRCLASRWLCDALGVCGTVPAVDRPADAPSRPPGIPSRTLRLAERLEAAGVAHGTPARDAWLRLRTYEGERANVIDLYALVASRRGLLPNELPLGERLALWRSVAAVIWPGFQVAQGSAPRHDSLEVVDYDPSWPAKFAFWRDRIKEGVGDFALRIEHVGSTSVPGLPAKPRIDIQVSVPDITQEDKYVLQVEAAGAQLRSRDDYHRYFRSFPGGPRVLQVHVCDVGSKWEADHLLFRDYLRSHSEARDAYAAVKLENAVVWRDDGVGYTDAKGEIILDVLEDARIWKEKEPAPPGRGTS